MNKHNKINTQELNSKIQKSSNILNHIIQKATNQLSSNKNISKSQIAPAYENKINKIYIRHKKGNKDVNSSLNSYGISQQRQLAKIPIHRTPQIKFNKFRIKDSLFSKQKPQQSYYSENKQSNQQIHSQQKRKSHCQFLSIPADKTKSFFSKKNLTKQSTSRQIYDTFSSFLEQNNCSISGPMIKRYKNCVYFGEVIQRNQTYNGFIYFWKGKIYYGQLKNQDKYGNGKQVCWIDGYVYEGTFLNGRKTGFFHVQKGGEKYEGELVDGQYEGEGKLTTPLSEYNGKFKKGLRHGKGQQYFFHSRLILKGNFTNGKFQNDIEQQNTKRKSNQPQQAKFQKLNLQKLTNHHQQYNKKRDPMFCIHCEQYNYSIETSSFCSLKKIDDFSNENPQEQFRDTVPKFHKFKQ